MGAAKAMDVQASAAAMRTARREVFKLQDWPRVGNDFMVPPVEPISVPNCEGRLGSWWKPVDLKPAAGDEWNEERGGPSDWIGSP